MTPKRVFILGLQRSGTTWLANMLASLPQVSAVEDERHRGVHESVFFSHFTKAFSPWHDLDKRARFFAAFRASDYVEMSGIEPELIDEFEYNRESYEDVFISFMDILAGADGADAWIEKSPHHTLLTQDLLRAAPDALFVMVSRNPKDLIQSRLHGFNRTPVRGLKRSVDIVRGALTSSLYTRHMKTVAKQQNAILVTYENLKDDPDLTVRQSILNHIGIDADPADMVSTYSANTSFDKAPELEWSKADQAILQVTSTLARLVPLSILKSMQNRKDESRGVVFPDWVWTINPGAATLQTDDQSHIILDERPND